MKKIIIEYLVFYLVNSITKHKHISISQFVFLLWNLWFNDYHNLMLWKCGFLFVEYQFPWMSFGFFQRNELFIGIQYPVNQCIDGINDYEFTYPWNSDFYWIDAFVCKWNHNLFCCPLCYHKHFSKYWHITYIDVVILI